MAQYLRLTLPDGFVVKHFGNHPERGRVIPGTTHTTMHMDDNGTNKPQSSAGMKWKYPMVKTSDGRFVRRKGPDGELMPPYLVPNPIVLRAMMALKRIGPNEWYLVVDPNFQRAAKAWLDAMLWQYKFDKQPKKRRRKHKARNINFAYIKVDNG